MKAVQAKKIGGGPVKPVPLPPPSPFRQVGLVSAVPIRAASAVIPKSCLVQRTAGLQRDAGNSAVTTMLQRNKKENVVGQGFTDAEAEDLKSILGGWKSAAELVAGDAGVKPSFLRAVMADHSNQMVRKMALENLTEHYYGVAKHLCALAGVDLASLIKKRLSSKTVDVMTGYPVPVFRATILSLSGVAEVKDVSMLGKIFDSFPAFDAVVQANLQGDAARLASVIGWLGTITPRWLRYLETNAPSYAVLKVLAKHSFDKDDLLLLAHYSQEDPPGNDDREYLGTKQKRRYRVGHFARFHTIRGMSSDNALPEGKTIWPVATSVDNVRDICTEFDDNTKFDTKQRYFYQPVVVPVRISVDAHGSGTYKPTVFDQMYPTSGTVVTVAAYAHLNEVHALKGQWTEP